MGNWLVSFTQLCCNQLNDISMTLSDVKGVCTFYNDNYYQTALNLVGDGYQSENGAVAFLQEVNTDLNAHQTILDGVGHVESAAILLSESIGNSSRTYDSCLGSLNPSSPPGGLIGSTFYRSSEFDAWLDALIQNTLSSSSVLNSILVSGSSALSDFYNAAKQIVQSAVNQYISDYPAYVESLTANNPVANQDSEGYEFQTNPNATSAFQQYCSSVFTDLANQTWTYLSDWADELWNATALFPQTIQSSESYLSARDLYDFIYNTIDGSQSTNKPITITPYTTPDGKQGLLITVGGTDTNHFWDTSLLTAGDTGLGDHNTVYEQDLQKAIAQYMQEHPEMRGAQVTFAGYSLGGMTAQNLVDYHTSFLQQYGLTTTNLITYGSPVMGAPQKGVNYTMYDATYDPIPLLSSYENPVIQVPLMPALVTIGEGYGMPWPAKLHLYIDRTGQYTGHIFNLSDVGSVLIPTHGPSLLQNHLEYYQSDQLNAPNTAVTTIAPNSLGPTEYFGMSNPGTN